MTAQTVQERVAAGAAWLDKHKPGWWQRINLDTLLMQSCARCVLGQLYGDYAYAPLTIEQTEALGFYGTSDVAAAFATFEDLDEAWRDLIAARRTALSTVAGAP